MDLSFFYPTIESILFICLFLLATIQIKRIRFTKSLSYSLFNLRNNSIITYFYLIIIFWNLLYVLSFIKISIIQQLIINTLSIIYILSGWLNYSLFIPIIIFFIITIIDLFWGAFLNNIEDYKTTEAKFAEAYRIRWTDRLIILIFILLPMIDLYGRHYSFMANNLPNLVIFLDPYFKYCDLLSISWPEAGFYIMPNMIRGISRFRGADSEPFVDTSKRSYDAKTKTKSFKLRRYWYRLALLPTRTVFIFRRFKNLTTTQAPHPKYFVRWNFTYIWGVWTLNRSYKVIMRLLFEREELLKTYLGANQVIVLETMSKTFYWSTFLLVFYAIFSSLQGKCAMVPKLNKASYYRTGPYRSLFKRKKYKQTKLAFLKFSLIFIIFFVYNLQEFFVNLLNPFFLLNLNYLTIKIKNNIMGSYPI